MIKAYTLIFLLASDPFSDLPQLPPAVFSGQGGERVSSGYKGRGSFKRKGFLSRRLPTLVCPIEQAEDILTIFL